MFSTEPFPLPLPISRLDGYDEDVGAVVTGSTVGHADGRVSLGRAKVGKLVGIFDGNGVGSSVSRPSMKVGVSVGAVVALLVVGESVNASGHRVG
jgi:hypothetical protein